MTVFVTSQDQFGQSPVRLLLLSGDSPDRCGSCTLRGAALCRAVWRAGKTPGRPARLRRFDADEMLFGEGVVPDFLGVLRRGYLRQERLTRDGRRTLLGLSRPGDIVGGLKASLFSLEAATEAEVCVLDIGAVKHALATDFDVSRHELQEASIQLQRQLELNWQRGALSSRERVFAFLVMAAEIMPVEPLPDGGLIVSIPLSRRDWAGLSNTTVETVSRTMGLLAERELVTKVAPSRYRIRDLRELASLAGLDPDKTAMGQPRQAETPPASAGSAPRLTQINALAPPRTEGVDILIGDLRGARVPDVSLKDAQGSYRH